MVSQSASWPEFFRVKLPEKFGIFVKKSRIFRVILPRKIQVMMQIETPLDLKQVKLAQVAKIA